ncbi:hypothetical protein GYH30_015866 [Glycine max]|uniref:Uncharacterized protein n=1 Tax=Glycine max TaxID=3847 RepID=A0A0R0JWF6_SOYBN|nr:hypothetical protein GYH30_015866 [Glycine max]
MFLIIGPILKTNNCYFLFHVKMRWHHFNIIVSILLFHVLAYFARRNPPIVAILNSSPEHIMVIEPLQE